MTVVGPNDSFQSVIGQLLGDGLAGSCWRAAEQAAQPDVEVRVYVRSLAEANEALTILISILGSRRLLPAKVDVETIAANSKKLDGLVAIELMNGSVVVLKKELKSP